MCEFLCLGRLYGVRLDGENRGMPEDYHLYSDLAPWFALITPPEHYKEEAAVYARLLTSAEIPVREVLELGSGGGHNASYLKHEFAMTLVDLSEDMLGVSRVRNPECEHVQGDMRDVRLGRDFDGVFVHDAISYMATEADLSRTIETAFAHCRPGGVAVFAPDHTREIFRPGTEHGGSDATDGRGARYLEWTRDPDPDDTWYETEFVVLTRDTDGSVHVSHDTHRLGLFPRGTWLHLLDAAGFAGSITETTFEDGIRVDILVGRRPL